MSNKSDPVKQHWVPRSYLRVFRDPASTKRKPFVWYFEKDKAFTSPVPQSPKSIMYEEHLYTIETSGGSRHYDIEHAYAEGVDASYPAIVQKIEKREPLDANEHMALCTFIAAQMMRTPQMRDAFVGFLNHVANIGEQMAHAQGKTSRMAEEMRMQAKNMHILNTFELIPEIAGTLFKMNVAFVCAPKLGKRFITSDNPVFLRNPDLRWQRALSPGLGQKNVELYFPASPSTLVILNWNNYRGYVQVSHKEMHEMNRLIQGHAVRWLAASAKKRNLYWFSRYPADPLFLFKIMRFRILLLWDRIKLWYAKR